MAEEQIELDVLGALAGSDGDPPEWPAVEVSDAESDHETGGGHLEQIHIGASSSLPEWMSSCSESQQRLCFKRRSR